MPNTEKDKFTEVYIKRWFLSEVEGSREVLDAMPQDHVTEHLREQRELARKKVAQNPEREKEY